MQPVLRNDFNFFSMSIKLISWNVNGIRAVLKKGFEEFLTSENPDILCLQETRANPSDVPWQPSNYQIYWNWCGSSPGYSGTAILTKQKLLRVEAGVSIEGHDQEGRVLTAEYDNFYLVNVYVPNAKRDLSRLPYRHKEWDVDFLKYLKTLEKRKPVIFCGDLNVAHKEIDLAHPEQNRGCHGFTDEEREGFDNFVKAGFLDTFREFHADGKHYTWWRQFGGCRARNVGWRIDYFLISKSLRPKLEDAFILPKVMGSDHCPVGILLK